MPRLTHAPRNAIEAAHHTYRMRRMRDQIFGSDLFGEPAWDLLLDLYIAASEPRPLSVIAASIAASEAADDVRWLRLLEEHGLVEWVDAESEMGPAIVTLSETAFGKMTRLLQNS